MPTVMKLGSYRFHFYSDEGNEPPHIHVETPDGECKFWLDPVRLARNKGVSPQNIRQIERNIFEYRDFLEDKFHEYFSHKMNLSNPRPSAMAEKRTIFIELTDDGSLVSRPVVLSFLPLPRKKN